MRSLQPQHHIQQCLNQWALHPIMDLHCPPLHLLLPLPHHLVILRLLHLHRHHTGIVVIIARVRDRLVVAARRAPPAARRRGAAAVGVVNAMSLAARTTHPSVVVARTAITATAATEIAMAAAVAETLTTEMIIAAAAMIVEIIIVVIPLLIPGIARTAMVATAEMVTVAAAIVDATRAETTAITRALAVTAFTPVAPERLLAVFLNQLIQMRHGRAHWARLEHSPLHSACPSLVVCPQ